MVLIPRTRETSSARLTAEKEDISVQFPAVCGWGEGKNNLRVKGWSSVAQAVPASTTNNCANKYKHKNHGSVSCDLGFSSLSLFRCAGDAKETFHKLPLASLPTLVIPVLSGQEQHGVEHFFALKEDDVTTPENMISYLSHLQKKRPGHKSVMIQIVGFH